MAVTIQNKWWGKIHLIALLGLFLRLVVALVSDTIHHPDEIFQYVEQAHRLVFGYGNIPWEYRHGIRSWILPGFIASILHIFHLFHMDDPNIYTPTIKILFCILSISLIYSSYVFTRNIASEAAARLVVILMSLWHELIYFASKPIPEVISSYFIILAMAILVGKPSKNNIILFGLSCGMATVLRFQYLPVIIILSAVSIFKWRQRNILISMITFLLVIAGAGYVDYLTWGDFFASYYNNYLYNSIYKVSELFGVEPVEYLLKGGAFITFVLGCLFPSKIKQTWLILLCILAIVVPHSLVAHKEYRFIFGAIPLCIILVSIISLDYITWLNKWKKTFYGISLVNISFSLIFVFINVFFWKMPLTQPTLPAYLYLHKQPGLVSLFNDYSVWADTGAYYYLHQKVPIYYPEMLKQFPFEDYSLYFSHILCNKNKKSIPGFSTIYSYRDLEIRRVDYPPKKYKEINIDTINLKQPGVDDRFQPRVKKTIASQ